MPASAQAVSNEPPTREPGERAFPPLILLLTGLAGLVDAVSYLALDRAFAATQTGNLIFLGLAGVQTPGFVIEALAVTLLAFVLGAFVTGRVLVRSTHRKTQLLRAFTAAQFVPIALAAVLQAAVVELGASSPLFVLLGLLAFAMGIQAAGTNRLRVPGLERTTVLTTTVTLVAADAFAIGESRTLSVRWIASIVALVAGAALGAALFSHLGLTVPLAVATVLVAIVAVSAFLLDLRAGPRAAPDPPRRSPAP